MHTRALGLAVLTTLAGLAATLNADAQLRVSSEGKFRIMQFTDIHHPEPNSIDESRMAELVRIHHPDLIVVTGDGIDASKIPNNPEEDWPLKTDQMMDFIGAMESLGTPWTMAIGNHDNVDSSSYDDIETRLSGARNSYYHSTDLDWGRIRETRGNHRIDLYNSAGTSVIWQFYLFNTLSEGLLPSSMGWYTKDRSARPRSTTPSFAFFHIPLRQYAGSGLYGNALEPNDPCPASVCYEETSESALAALVTNNLGLKAVFVGHDHDNDYYRDAEVSTRRNVRLHYGRHLGGYGLLLPGARLIDIFTTANGSDYVSKVVELDIEGSHRLIPLRNHVLDWVPDSGDYKLWNFAPSEGDPLPGDPVTSKNWRSIRKGHELIPIGDYVLDWEPASGNYRLWNYNPRPNADPLPGEPVKQGNWESIRTGHELVPLDNYILDWVPATGSYRLWMFDPNAQGDDPLSGEPVQEDRWFSILTGHRLIPVGGYVLDWEAPTGGYRLWTFDPNSATGDPLSGPVQSGTWKSIQTGHDLVPVEFEGRLYVLDWIRRHRSNRLWTFSASSSDPLPTQVGSWRWDSIY